MKDENPQFISEHIKFKMPNGYPVEMLRRQLDIRVCSSGERSRQDIQIRQHMEGV